MIQVWLVTVRLPLRALELGFKFGNAGSQLLILPLQLPLFLTQPLDEHSRFADLGFQQLDLLSVHAPPSTPLDRARLLVLVRLRFLRQML